MSLLGSGGSQPKAPTAHPAGSTPPWSGRNRILFIKPSWQVSETLSSGHTGAGGTKERTGRSCCVGWDNLALALHLGELIAQFLLPLS